jgi:hypothetical protein
MAEEERLTAAEWHRKMGVSCFNACWKYIEVQERSEEETDLMINLAYVSAWHWRQCGEPKNVGRGHWQLSRVFALAGCAPQAIYHARKYLSICETSDVEDWDHVSAHEAMARAQVVAGDWTESERQLELGYDAGAKVKDEEDRKIVVGDLDTVPRRPGA